MAAVITVNINKHLALACFDLVHGRIGDDEHVSLQPMFGEITPFIFKLYQKFILSFEGLGPKDLRIIIFFIKLKFTADFMADTLTDRLGGLEIWAVWV